MDDGTAARFHPQGDSSSNVGEVSLKICIFCIHTVGIYIYIETHTPISINFKMRFQNPPCLLHSFVSRMNGIQVYSDKNG